jgi:endonuclease/exonuclease/phosphatase (EEP) superfamily protein YafD
LAWRRMLTWKGLVAGAFIVPFAAWALVRLLGLEDHAWPLVAAMAYTTYAALLALLPVALALALRRWVVAGIAALVALCLAACVVPRGLGGPDRAHGPALRAMTSNLRVGGADPGTLVALVRRQGVDLLALQEFTPRAEEALRDAGLERLLPYHAAYPVDGVGGAALYSRYPLRDTGFRPLPPFFGQAYATLDVPGAVPVLVESAHPCAPSDPSRITDWRHDLAAEPRAIPHGPVRLLLGDFNATLDHAPLRALIGSGYRDAASVVGAGFVPTWPYDGRLLPKTTIDHVLADQRIGVRRVSAYPIPDTDHRALFAELTLPAGG